MENKYEKGKGIRNKLIQYSIFGAGLIMALPTVNTIYNSINKNFDKKEVKYVIDKSYGKLEELKEGLIGNFSNKNSIDSFLDN